VDLNSQPAFSALSYSWKQDKSLASLFSTSGKFSSRYSKWGLIQNINTEQGQRGPVSIDERHIKSKEIMTELLSEPSFTESWIPRTIFCDGKSMTIKPNLYNALLHLRKHRPGVYWIDAVCINQVDSVERNAQVQIMGRIYRSAAEVVVWLGDVPVALDAGMQRLSDKLATLSGTAPLSFGENGDDLALDPSLVSAAVGRARVVPGTADNLCLGRL
jgi:hypothetical protein